MSWIQSHKTAQHDAKRCHKISTNIDRMRLKIQKSSEAAPCTADLTLCLTLLLLLTFFLSP